MSYSGLIMSDWDALVRHRLYDRPLSGIEQAANQRLTPGVLESSISQADQFGLALSIVLGGLSEFKPDVAQAVFQDRMSKYQNP